MSYYDDSSLFVAPNGYKASVLFAQKPMDANGQLAFTRSNDTATRVASNGLIEKVRTNQIRNSSMVGASTPNTLPTNWTTSLSGLTREIVGVGTENGLPYIDFKLSGTATGVISSLQFENNSTIIAAQGQLWTHSAYFKLIGGTALPNQFLLSIYEYNSVGNYQSEGSVNIKSSITSNLQRFSFVRTLASVNTTRVQPLVQFALTNGATYDFTYRVAAPQMETGDIATDWISTTTAARSVGPVANIPRIDYLGGGCGKLLLEPQRTNTILWSEQINTTKWPSSTRINVTENALVSPDGYQNADLIIPNTTSGNHGPAQNVSSLTSGATYSCSIYAKAQGYSKFLILAGAGTGSGQYEFDLNAGTAQAGATITSVGNGWYRCTAPLVPNSSLLQYLIFISNGSAYSYTGNGTSGIAFWGAQVELGAHATSYVNTLAASVTRGADACSKTGISSLIGQTEGTMFLDINVPSITSAGTYASHTLNDGTSSNQIEFTYYPTGRIQAVAIVGGSVNVNINLTSYGLTAGNHKIAFAYKLNDYVLYVDGAQAGADTSASVPATSVFNLYAGSGSTQVYKQALLFKTRLPNSELASLTTL